MAASGRDLAQVVAQDAKASMTAVSVAMAFTRTLEAEYGYLFSKVELDLATHFMTLGRQGLEGASWFLFSAVSSCPNRFQRFLLDKLVLPGFDLHMMLRKLMIKNKIHSAIEEGVEQVVFLGGGYDIRAFVSALQFPLVEYFECDRGQTRRIKVGGLGSIPEEIELDFTLHALDDGTVAVNHNLHYIDCDLLLPGQLQLKLIQHGFSPARKTLVIAEGLTMYFNEDEIKNLLGQLSAILSENDEVILSFMTETHVSSVNTAAVKNSNETLRFALPRERVVPFVRDAGFSVVGQFNSMNRFEELGAEREAEQVEYYYQLQRADYVPDKDLSDVPEMAFDIRPELVIEQNASDFQPVSSLR